MIIPNTSEAIITTMHEPMIILDKDLGLKSANKSFYEFFFVKEEETEGALLFELGDKQRDTHAWAKCLKILSAKTPISTTLNAIIEATKLCPANIISFHFSQLMHNLIGNALKFSKKVTPPHIITIGKIVKGSKLNNKNLSPGKNYCHIIVKDNVLVLNANSRNVFLKCFKNFMVNKNMKAQALDLPS